MSRRAGATALPLMLAPAAAHAGAPLQYLTTQGPRADPATVLLWGLTAISVVVTLLVSGLVVAGVLARRARGVREPAEVPVLSGGGGMRWLGWGVGLTMVALVVSTVWTVAVIAQVNGPPRPSTLTIDVHGAQWWWRAAYGNPDPRLRFETANELHIPVGSPVRVRLQSEDVIHSFWAPALTGKTDTIPGRVNETWIEATRPGRYMGQCTEYCGLEHARMAFFVQADTPAAYAAWARAQAAPAGAPRTAEALQGEQVFEAHCAQCHTVRGVAERGRKGPDLTHVASRPTLAAGALPNTVAALGGWISDPQAIKPGNHMPTPYLSGPDLQAVVAYLETLK